MKTVWTTYLSSREFVRLLKLRCCLAVHPCCRVNLTRLRCQGRSTDSCFRLRQWMNDQRRETRPCCLSVVNPERALDALSQSIKREHGGGQHTHTNTNVESCQFGLLRLIELGGASEWCVACLGGRWLAGWCTITLLLCSVADLLDACCTLAGWRNNGAMAQSQQ
jgi:hypothetical protein